MDVRYAETRRRVHRVLIEGGHPFTSERCNLDDALANLADTPGAKPHCRWCWITDPPKPNPR